MSVETFYNENKSWKIATEIEIFPLKLSIGKTTCNIVQRETCKHFIDCKSNKREAQKKIQMERNGFDLLIKWAIENKNYGIDFICYLFVVVLFAFHACKSVCKWLGLRAKTHTHTNREIK